ncbi:MAG: hypothetical protein ACRDZ3_02580 [Acidimicrobiia bacterium]
MLTRYPLENCLAFVRGKPCPGSLAPPGRPTVAVAEAASRAQPQRRVPSA